MTVAIEELKSLAPFHLAACASSEISDSMVADSQSLERRGLRVIGRCYMTRGIPAASLTAFPASFVDQRIALIGVPIDLAIQTKKVSDALDPRASCDDFDRAPTQSHIGYAL